MMQQCSCPCPMGYHTPSCASRQPMDGDTSMTEPLNLAFNAAVFSMASRVCPMGYDVAYDGSAPESLEALWEHIDRTGRILIDGRNSENTIFADREINYAFRAWHDWTHFILKAQFDLDGEMAVAHRQIEDLALVFGHGPQFRYWAEIIWAEVYGQACYFKQHGVFPVDQMRFTRDWYYVGPEYTLRSDYSEVRS
jgi:hypothetical protein